MVRATLECVLCVSRKRFWRFVKVTLGQRNRDRAADDEGPRWFKIGCS